MDKVKEHATDDITHLLNYGFEHYKDFLFGLFVGLIIAWAYHRFIGMKSLKDSYEKVISSKDDFIETLKVAVLDRLEDVNVQAKDKSFISRLKNVFKQKK